MRLSQNDDIRCRNLANFADFSSFKCNWLIIELTVIQNVSFLTTLAA